MWTTDVNRIAAGAVAWLIAGLVAGWGVGRAAQRGRYGPPGDFGLGVGGAAAAGLGFALLFAGLPGLVGSALAALAGGGLAVWLVRVAGNDWVARRSN